MKNSLDSIKEVAVYLLNLRKGNFLYISPSVFELFGYLPKHFLEGGVDFIYSRVHPEDFRKALEKYASYMEQIHKRGSDGVNVLHFKYRFRKENGVSEVERKILLE